MPNDEEAVATGCGCLIGALVLVSVLVAAVRGCSDKKEQAAWNRAERGNSISAYEQYLEDYDTGEHANTAKHRIASSKAEQQAFQRLGADSTLGDLRSYLQRFPSGSNRSAVLGFLEQVQYASLSSNPTIDSLTAYLAEFPRGTHRDQVNAQLNDLLWDQIEQQPSFETFDAYLERFPNGDRVAEAKRRANRLAWATLSEHPDPDLELIERYLRYRPEVKGTVFEGTTFAGSADEDRVVEELLWREIERSPAFESLDLYHLHFRSGPHYSQVRQRLEEAIWNRIENTYNMQMIGKYKELFPNGSHRTTVDAIERGDVERTLNPESKSATRQDLVPEQVFENEKVQVLESVY